MAALAGRLREKSRLPESAFVTLLVFFCNAAVLHGGDTLSVQGSRFLLDGELFDMWGVRVVNALWNDQETQELIAAMPDYIAHGVNTIGVNLQGGGPENNLDSTGAWYWNSAFRPDGSLKSEYMERLRQILERARELDMVVNIGYFYQRQCRKASETDYLDFDHWDSSDAIYDAVRNATEWLRPYRHVFLDVANEYGHSAFQYPEVFSTERYPADRVPLATVLVDVVHEVDPDRLCGVSPKSDEGILDIPGADIFYTHGHPQIHMSGDRPQVNNEQLNRGYKGVYTEAEREQIKSEAQVEHDYGNYWFWHSTWLQYEPFNFHLGGYGTEEDPGDRWIFEHIFSLTSALQVNITAPLESFFELLEPINFEGEAYADGQLITTDTAYEWYYDQVGGAQDVFISQGRVGTLSISTAGTYVLELRVTHEGQSKTETHNFFVGVRPGDPLSLGVVGSYPAITVDMFDRAHLVFVGSDGVYYMRYDNNGWSTAERIPGSGGALDDYRQVLDIAVDSHCVPHVLWINSASVNMTYSAFKDGEWTAPQEVCGGSLFSAATDSYDNLWLAYRGTCGLGECFLSRMKLAVDVEDFSDVMTVYDDGSDRSHVYGDVAGGKDGSVYFVWRWDNLDGSDYDPFFREYRDGGWTGVECIHSSDKKVLEGLGIAVAPDGKPWVTYYDTGGRVKAARRETWGWSISNLDLYYDYTSWSHYPVIAIDSLGCVYVTSHQGSRDGVAENSRVQYVTYTSAQGWSGAQPIDSTHTMGVGQPAIAAGHSCAHVVWMDTSGSIYHRILGEVTEIYEQPPVPVASAEPTAGHAPLVVQFTGSSSSDPDGYITSYLWEFGDGDTSHQEDPVHTFFESGSYEPRLYVTDNSGLTEMTFVYVEVTPQVGEGIISNVSPLAYATEYVKEGDTYYVDRTHEVIDIPPAYEDLLWIKTRNADKTNNDITVSFVADVRLQVYVAHDSRVPQPEWLSGDFSLADDAIDVTDDGNTDFRLWQSNETYARGDTVTLGANGAESGASSMYVVLVRNTETEPNLTTQADRVGDDVVLSWVEIPDVEHYNIYRGTDPYFEPDTPIATAGGLQYTDIGQAADSVGNCYYVVEAVRSGGMPAVRRRLAKCNRVVVTGRNLVSLPVVPSSTSLTDVLGDVLTGGSNYLNSDRIMKWTGNGYEVAWLVEGTGTEYDGQWFNEAGTGVSSITIGPDEGFWVEVHPANPPANLTFLGQISADSARTIEVRPGMNLIGSCYPVSVELTDSELREDGVVIGAPNSSMADRVLMWKGTDYEVAWLADSTGTAYDGVWMNGAGTDTTSIKLEPGKAYWLQIRNAEGPRTWTYPNPNPDN